jgi:hypothetical protein
MDNIAWGAVAFLLVQLVFGLIWLVRLEGKVKQNEKTIVDCQSHRDRMISEDRESKIEIFHKLDKLLEDVSHIKGTIDAQNGKGRK